MKAHKVFRFAGLSVLVLALLACGDLLEVENPGPITADALNDVSAFPALVAGMSGDLSVALSRTSEYVSVWGDELTHSGTHGEPTEFAAGLIQSQSVNSWWVESQKARWVAENGIGRMRKILGSGFSSSPLAARALVLAGFSNRLLGEQLCETVIDGGGIEPFSTHFDRAEEQFTEAIQIARTIAASDLENAALGGRASVRAALGNWDGATQDAAAVPLDFQYDAIYSLNTSRENHRWVARTITRGEYTVYGTQWAEVTDDPRTPWDPAFDSQGDVRVAADGKTPWYRQGKYLTEGDDIALTKGTEMALIRAEAALRSGEIGTALAHINGARAQADLDPVSASDLDQAWTLLHRERGATLWLEGRRLWDLRRWLGQTGPAHNSWLEDRATCVPIADIEVNSNPNLGK